MFAVLRRFKHEYILLMLTPEGRIFARFMGILKNIQFDILRSRKEQLHCQNLQCKPSRIPYLQIHGAGARLQAPTLSSPTNIKCCSKALPPNCISLSFILKAVTPLISMKKKRQALFRKKKAASGEQKRWQGIEAYISNRRSNRTFYAYSYMREVYRAER